MKVGGIIHLTKEIPGLVRTFAPVIEYLSEPPHQYDPQTVVHTEHHPPLAVAAVPSRQSGVDGDAVDSRQDSDTTVQVATQQRREEREKEVDESADIRQNLLQNDQAPTSLVGQSVVSQSGQETHPDVGLRLQNTSSSTVSSTLATAQSAPADDQLSSLFEIDFLSVQPVDVTTATTDTTPVLSFSDAKSRLAAVSDGAKITADRSESRNRREDCVSPAVRPALPPVRPEKVETASAAPPPPPPPPKLRTASQYHASLGITNSLTSAPPAAASATEPSSFLRRRNDDGVVANTSGKDVVANVSSPAAELPTKQQKYSGGGGVVDRFQLANLHADDGADESRERPIGVNNLPGCDVDSAVHAHFRFPRAAQTTEPVVLRRPPTNQEAARHTAASCAPASSSSCSRVSESELETPDFRASGVSQTTVDQLEANINLSNHLFFYLLTYLVPISAFTLLAGMASGL